VNVECGLECVVGVGSCQVPANRPNQPAMPLNEFGESAPVPAGSKLADQLGIRDRRSGLRERPHQ
jgi:hypothetical protein